MVSSAPRTTSAVTWSTVGASLIRPRLAARATRSTFVTGTPRGLTENLTFVSDRSPARPGGARVPRPIAPGRDRLDQEIGQPVVVPGGRAEERLGAVGAPDEEVEVVLP